VRCRAGEGMTYFRPGIGLWLLATGHWPLGVGPGLLVPNSITSGQGQAAGG